MYLLVAVIEKEEILDEIITGWVDLGVAGSTVIETTGSLQLITDHVPIFAGLRSLTSGGVRHNRTIFTVIEDQEILDQAILFLEETCRKTGKPSQGIYFVTSVSHFNRLGIVKDVSHQDQKRKGMKPSRIKSKK